MFKKSVTYQDFDDNTVTETLYFNLSKAELLKRELTHGGKGYTAWLQSLTATGDNKNIMIAFEDIVSMAYGTKTENGRSFHKSPEQSADFLASPAYDALFTEFMADPTVAAAFMQGLLPADLIAPVNQQQAATNAAAASVPVPPVTTQPVAASVQLPPTPAPAVPATGPQQDAVPNAFRNRRGGRGPHRPVAPATSVPAESVEDVNLANATPEQLQAALARIQAQPPASS